MPNLAVTTRFNESKHQMTTEQTDDAVPIADITGTRFGVLFKTLSQGFNQVAFKSHYYDVIDYCRDNNVLDRINAGEWTGTHLLVSADRNGDITVVTLAAGVWWSPAPDDSVSIAIPMAAGWVADGSTVYLNNIAKRTYEKVRETYLVHF